MKNSDKFRNRPVLIFDLGRVLIDFDPDIIISRLRPYTYWSREDIYRLFATADFVDAFERGRLSKDEFFTILHRGLSINGMSKEALAEIWNDIFSPNLEMLSLLRYIKENTPIGLVLLSNISQVHFEYLYREYEELSFFDEYVLSYKEGYRKPEAMIYNKVKSITRLATSVLYTDDIEQFVYAARLYGIDAVHFKGYKEFLREIEKRNGFCCYFKELIQNESKVCNR